MSPTIIKRDFKLHGMTLVIAESSYVQGGATAWQLFDANGDDYAVITINLPGLAPDELAIKSYSENEGVLEALLAADVIELPHRWVASGFVSIPVVRKKERQGMGDVG